MANGSQGRCKEGVFWSIHRVGETSLAAGSMRIAGRGVAENSNSARISAINKIRFGGGLCRVQQLDEYPFFQPAPGTLRKSEKLYACLPHRVSPGHSARAFYPHLGVAQFEAQEYLLVSAQRSHRLNSDARVAQIADDAAIRLIQIQVGQSLNLVAVVTASPPGSETSCSRVRSRSRMP